MANDISLEVLEKNRTKNMRLLSEYRMQAEQSGVPADMKKLPRISEGEVIRRRGDKRHIRAYMTQMLNYVLDEVQDCECAFVLFDEDGCMIRIKATASLGRWLEQKGIVLGSIWRMEEIGPNAVSLGLKDYHAHSSAGDENYLDIMKDMAVYYSSADLTEKGHYTHFGGLGLIVPLRYQNPAYLLTVTSMSQSFITRMSMAWNTSDAYEAGTKGMVLVDVNTKTGAAFVTHHNYGFFDILGLPRASMKNTYFRPAEEYFDPLPLNKQFWSIVREVQAVEDQDLTLYVHGKPVECIITTVPNGDSDLRAKGVLIYITSRRQIARQAAEKTGNNAVVSFDNIIGSSPIMKSKIKRAKLLARTDSNIMLLGESGVGKDVFAQAIHNQSTRWKEPFVAVNCGAIPRELIASELFGYDGGAFTGAKKQGNIGKFELANGGTLFLDEIGEMPLDLQANLLRAVEQKQFMRLGSSKVIHADVKIISATNVDITQMIQEKRFRADLYYRLCTMSLFLPPLRERRDDIIQLVEHFIREVSMKIGRDDLMTVSEDAKDFLRIYEWKGNVRELQNLIDCLVQLYPDPEITVELIKENINPAYFHEPEISAKDPVPERAIKAEAIAKNQSLPLLTREEILDALEQCEGNRSKAAVLLGVGRRTLYRYIDQFEIGNKKE